MLEIHNHPWITAAVVIALIISSLKTRSKRKKEKKEAIKKCEKLINIGLYTKAIEYCNSIAKKYKDPVIYRYLGQAYLQIGQIDNAIESFKRVEELSNGLRRSFSLYTMDKARFYEEFADILRDANKIDEAMLYYKKALEERKKVENTTNKNIMNLLQKIEEISKIKGNLDEAIHSYEEVILHLNPPKESSIDLDIAKKLAELHEKKGNTIIANKMREKIKEKEGKENKEKKEENEKKEDLTSTTDNPII
jgi:tetratricopeptide (TPR) repeat protein